LEEFIVKDGDVFMVEVRFGDKWPRDQENKDKEVERDWRNFEVGDKIDIFDVIAYNVVLSIFIEQ
jgi:hypothetical protein